MTVNVHSSSPSESREVRSARRPLTAGLVFRGLDGRRGPLLLRCHPHDHRHGDLAPTSSGTQIFTIVYILIGLGVFVALLTSLAQQFLRRKAEGRGAGRERLASLRHNQERG